MLNCRIWVTTPSFRSLRWLPSAVASVADQAGNGVEVHHHIQDGGSDDGTHEWLAAYAEQCACAPKPGYTFSYESASDGGMYEALNTGWSKAPKGIDFLAHLNSDEQYLPEALQAVAEIFEQNPAWEVVLADMIVVNSEGNYICHRRSLKPSPLIFRYTCGGMTAATFQRASVFQERGIRFEPDWRIIADKVWYLKMIQSGVAIGHQNRLVSVFMETGNNLGWSAAVHEEGQRYAARFLGGKSYGVTLVDKWNALRRVIKEWRLDSPTSYALFTSKYLQQRQSFWIANPTSHWGKHLKQPSQEPFILSLIQRAFRHFFPTTNAQTMREPIPISSSQKQPEVPLKILITEAYTDANVGSGALIENALSLLRERFPTAQIRVMAIYPHAFEELCHVESVPDPYRYPYKKPVLHKIIWLFSTFFWMALIRLQARKGLRKVRFFSSKIDHYLWADWVVSAHAERIKESFHVDALYTLFSFHIAHLLGKKVILFPCTLGPYGFGTRPLVDRWLREVDVLFTRDDISYNLAHKAKGLAHEKIVNCSDVAVIQNYISREEALEIIGCSPQDKLVGVSVMRWRYIKGNVSPYSNYASYVTEMAKLIDHLITTYGVKVVLYPTNYAIRGCTTEDREAIRAIYKAATRKESIVQTERFLKPEELKGALACSEVNIVTRMHACIFSTGANVPTLSVNYLYKLREYMESLGLADYSIDIEYFNAEWMQAAFDKMWNRRPEIRQQITQHMEAKRALLHEKMDTLRDLK